MENRKTSFDCTGWRKVRNDLNRRRQTQVLEDHSRLSPFFSVRNLSHWLAEESTHKALTADWKEITNTFTYIAALPELEFDISVLRCGSVTLWHLASLTHILNAAIFKESRVIRKISARRFLVMTAWSGGEKWAFLFCFFSAEWWLFTRVA